MSDFRPLDARYLYVLKDSPGIYYVTGEPTLGDIERVKTGHLAIVRLADLRHLGEDEQWHTPEVGVLNTLYDRKASRQPINLPLALAEQLRRLQR